MQNGSGYIKHREGEEGDALDTGANITLQPMSKIIPEQGKRKGKKAGKERSG